MTEENDQSKTEEPTERRLERAFDEGQVAFSRELLHWSVLATSGALLFWIFPHLSRTFLITFQQILSSCGDSRASASHSPFYPKLLALFFEITLFLFIIVFIVVSVGFSQTKLNITLSQIRPKWERISPVKGFSKIYGKQAFIEFFKNLLKITVIGYAMVWTISGTHHSLFSMPILTFLNGFDMMKSLFGRIFVSVLSILGLIVMLDYAYQYFQHRKRLKMSHQEIKEEHKEQEGSPEMKGRLKELRMQRMRSRILNKVKASTVVVTNPTHYAVALQWDEKIMEAPRVVAKGVDFLALQIRKLAKDYHVPIVENVPLARTLYEKVDLDREIQPEHYRAVAEIIKYITDAKNKWFKVD